MGRSLNISPGVHPGRSPGAACVRPKRFPSAVRPSRGHSRGRLLPEFCRSVEPVSLQALVPLRDSGGALPAEMAVPFRALPEGQLSSVDMEMDCYQRAPNCTGNCMVKPFIHPCQKQQTRMCDGNSHPQASEGRAEKPTATWQGLTAGGRVRTISKEGPDREHAASSPGVRSPAGPQSSVDIP